MEKKIGILGGGQLGRMLALAAHPLGIKVVLVDQNENCSASDVADVGVYEFSDKEKIAEFFNDVDVITYEFENIPVELLEYLAKTKQVYPPLKALNISRHRAEEKKFVTSLGIPTPEFKTVSSLQELERISAEVEFPLILKTCSEGYDGKGQFRFFAVEDLRALIASQPKETGDLIAEQMVKFDFEVSCLAARSVEGEINFYSICENSHDHGILAYTKSPSSRVSSNIEKQAQEYTKKILEALNYVGVIAVEYFVVGEQLLFNEYAPRVHNSGHWSIEGAVTSQFENHLRACLDLPLGSTEPVGYSLMLNLLGTKGQVDKLLKTPKAYYHWYGKKGISGRRKVGHVTFVYEQQAERDKVDLKSFT